MTDTVCTAGHKLQGQGQGLHVKGKTKDMTSKAKVKRWTYKAKYEKTSRPCLEYLYYI